MRAARSGGGPRFGWAVFFAALLAITVVVAGVRDGRATAQIGPGELTTEPILKSAAAGVEGLYGATPGEAAGEVWGAGTSGIVHYTAASGWAKVPSPVGLNSLPLSFFSTATGRTAGPGGVALAVTVEEVAGEGQHAALALRNPGGEFHLAPPVVLPVESEEAGGETPEGEGEEGSAESPEGGETKGGNAPPAVAAMQPAEGESVAEEPPEAEEGAAEELQEREALIAPPSQAAAEETTEGEPPAGETAEGEPPAEETTEGEPPAEETPGPPAKTESVSELFASPPLIAVSEEGGGVTGAFSVPPSQGSAAQDEVLHFDGSTWSREQVCMASSTVGCPSPLASFKVLAIEATGPENAWLLGERGAADGIELFKREGAFWRQQVLSGSLGLEYSRRSPAPGVVVTASKTGQPLTLSGSSGLWVDAEIGVGTEVFDSTIYIAGNQVEGAWCDATGAAASLCTSPLGSELPSGPARSFAWPGGESEPFGTRVVTGIGRGALLLFSGDSFERVVLGSGEAGKESGAAFGSLEEGWLGRGAGPLRVTREPATSKLAPFPVPFRRPLTALAPAPGQPVGALTSEALAVGDQGQVARYLPGQGWVAESLLNSAGVRATPRLRAVAWPEPNFAFAVGDEGAMWYWRKSTDLWEPDPAAPPNLIRNNFTGIAFDPGEPARGYAVGKQGLLLAYGRQWTQEPLPAGIPAEANFTSISFAGGEALVTWRYPLAEAGKFEGGLIANDGSGWKLVPEISPIGPPILVSGLPDGGAAVAFEKGEVAERNGPGAGWVETSQSAGGFPAALQALREEGAVRALVSVWPQRAEGGVGYPIDFEQVASHEEGAPPILTKPYELAARGYLERQTATGWRDEQHESFAVPAGTTEGYTDLPREPDPILALLVAPEGGEGWVVGGETGERVTDLTTKKDVQTASVERYGPAAAPPANVSAATIPSEAETATFAIGGGAQCASTCADQLGTGIGPEIWLASAISRAATIPGMRGFLYAGPGVASGEGESLDASKRPGAALSPSAFGREEIAYARRIAAGSSAGLPAFAAPTTTDLDRQESLSTFAGAFAGVTPIAGEELARGYYAFDSAGATGVGSTVKVIVLNYSQPTLGSTQQCWVAEQLEAAGAAGMPAIVLGSRDLSGLAPTEARALDSVEASELLVEGTSPVVASTCPRPHPVGASAYFFDFPEANRTFSLTAGGRSIPTFGTGTLGYVKSPFAFVYDFAGASGFLVASVGRPDPITDVAPVKVRLIPNIGELAMEAADGTLLRRSSVALFRGLARRPRAGGECEGPSPEEACGNLAPDPYVQIPSTCRGANCSSAVFPEYKFVSSRPDIADFVAPELNSGSSHAIKVGADGKPIADPTSGLLCAFNAGTTTVTLEAGGLAYSTVVTVQGGSVQRPCGTVPLVNPPVEPKVATPPVPAPISTPTPVFQTPAGPLPLPATPNPPPNPTPVIPGLPAPSPPPSTPPPPSPPPTPPPAIPPPPFSAPLSLIAPIPVIVPPAPPAAAEPAPPTGTSPVTQPAVSPQAEEEEEAAYDLVHHAAAYRPEPRSPAALAAYRAASDRTGGSGPGYLVPLLVVFLAVAATGVAGRRRRPTPAPAYQRTRR